MKNNYFEKMKKFIIGSTLALTVLFMPTVAVASYGQPQEPSRQIIVNKLVFNPATNQFVDNLGADQHLFLPEQDVTYRVQVTNTSEIDLNNVWISDKLPIQVNFVNGPGTVDKNTNTLSFTIEKLKIGETKTFDIKVKIKGANELSTNVSCISNFAQAKVEDLMDEDTSAICLQKKILGVTTELPRTGVNTTTASILGSLLVLGLSITLLKKSQVVK